MTERFIEWDRDRLLVAEGSANGGRVSLRTVQVLDRKGETTDTLGLLDGLKNAFPSAGDKKRPGVIVVFPRQAVTFQRISLPQIPDAEMADMIRMQATMKLTVPVESVCMDFTPLPGLPGSATRDVLLVTVPAEQISIARRTLHDAGCELAEVRVSSYCIAQAMEQADLLNQTADSNAVDVIALMRRDFIELTFIRGKFVVFSHSGNSWSAADAIERTLRSELTRARMSASDILGEHRIGRIVLLGSPDVTAAVTDQLSTRFDSAVIQRVDPTTFLTGPTVDGIAPSELVTIAGAIYGQAKSAIETVDLIHPRKSPEKKDLRRVKILAGILAGVVVIGSGYLWRKGKLEQLQGDLEIVEGRNTELSEIFQAGEKNMELHGQVDKWVKHDIGWLDQLVLLKSLLPKTDRIFVDTFQMDSMAQNAAGTIKITLFARTLDDIEQLDRQLTSAGFGLKPYNVAAKAAPVSPEYRQSVTLEVTLPEDVVAQQAILAEPLIDSTAAESDTQRGQENQEPAKS